MYNVGMTPSAGSRFARAAIVGCVALAVCWWLAADTLGRYWSSPSDGSAIRFAHFGSYQDYELWRDVIAEFMQDHPEIDVRQEYVVGLAGHYHLKLRQQILSGTLPDVALIQLGPFHEMAEHFADLSDLLRPPREGEPPGEPRWWKRQAG